MMEIQQTCYRDLQALLELSILFNGSTTTSKKTLPKGQLQIWVPHTVIHNYGDTTRGQIPYVALTEIDLLSQEHKISTVYCLLT